MDPKKFPPTYGIIPPPPTSRNGDFEPTNVKVKPQPSLSDHLKMIVNELRGPEQGKLYPTPSQIQKSAEPQPFFDQESLCKVKLRLTKLQNLKTSNLESSGDYLIRVTFMGETYARLLSGTVDITSLVYLTRHPGSQQHLKKVGEGHEKVSEPTHTPTAVEGIDGEGDKTKMEDDEEDPLKAIKCADVHLQQDIRMELRYVDMLDNPVICSISYVKDILEKNYGTVEPFGYLTLDILTFIKHGMTISFRVPWVLIPERTPFEKVPGLPILLGEINGFGGLPSVEQLQYGNMTSIVIESMYRLPKEIQGLTMSDKIQAEIYLRFPCPNNYFTFPGGELRKIIYTNTLEQFDNYEGDDESSAGDKLSQYEIPPVDPATGIPIYVNDTDFCFHRHWASVPEFNPDVPPSATALLQSKCIPMNNENLLGDMSDDFGTTGDSTWEEFLTSFDTRISWNALHRFYMDPNRYKEMLQKMSKQTIWPMEVVIFEKDKIEKSGHDIVTIKSSHQTVPSKNASAVQSTSLIGPPSPPKDISFGSGVKVLYHGVAFLDFTKALEPGAKTIRLALRIYPYSEAARFIESCGMSSLFLDILQKKNDIGKPKREGDRSNLESPEDIDRKESASSKMSKKKSGRSINRTNTPDIQGLQIDPNAPFLICQLNFRRPIIPVLDEKEEDNKWRSAGQYKPMQKFQKKTLKNATSAQISYRKAVLEASSELSHEFHAAYMEQITKHGINRKIVNSKDPKATFESIKKGFLFYLNASGRYLVLREHLRHAVADIVEQKCLNSHPQGFKNQRQFQTFLHDLYMWMVDEMHEVLNTGTNQELDLLDLKKGWEDKRNAREIEYLLNFAQEAFAQGDYENAHRIHVERIARSNNSVQSWTDFAVMWLSRGDDRLAEIAIQEALKIEPDNLLALIIAGSISSTHRDSKSITYLNKALKQRPNCPEIIILLAWAHTSLGNDLAAAYYFQKAKYIHHIMTGKDTSALHQEFQRVSIAMKSLTPGTTTEANATEEDEEEEEEQEEEEASGEILPAPIDKLTAKTEGSMENPPPVNNLSSPKSKSRIGTNNYAVEITKENLDTTRPPYLGSDLTVTWNVTKASRGQMHNPDVMIADPILPPVKGVNPNAEEALLKKIDEMLERQSRFDIPIPLTIDEIQLQLHPEKLRAQRSSFLLNSHGKHKIHSASSHREAFGPESHLAHRSNTSIAMGNDPNIYLSPPMFDQHYMNPLFDDPRYSKTVELDKLDKHGHHHHHHHHGHDHNDENCDHPSHQEEEGEDDENYEEEEAIGHSHGHHDIPKFFHYHEHTHHHHPHHHHHHRHENSDQTEEEEGSEHDEEEEQETPAEIHAPASVQAFSIGGSVSTRTIGYSKFSDGYSSDSFSHSTSSSSSAFSSRGDILNEEMDGEDADLFTGKGKQQKLTKRVGSEFIWTGHLLLKLRLFDCLDGLLAKEIVTNPQRSIEFLYIRAMSLHLRGRDKEALEFINEALTLDPQNGPLWALRGHVYYNLRDTHEGLFSYEKVLTLPHGRESLHLVYLRFGALCLEKDDPILAKRIFLKRAQVTSTPYLWIAIGNTSYYLKEYEEAELAFAEAKRLDNTNPIIWAHLALVSLTLGHQTLAEQSFKWAVRFGLKDCKLMEEIKELHKTLGFGNPAFPRIPLCIPHEYYLNRLGRDKPFEMYKDALNFPEFGKSRRRFENSEREEELIQKLRERQRKDMEAAAALAASKPKSNEDYEGYLTDHHEGSEAEFSGFEWDQEEKDFVTPESNTVTDEIKDVAVKTSGRKISKPIKAKGALKRVRRPSLSNKQ